MQSSGERGIYLVSVSKSIIGSSPIRPAFCEGGFDSMRILTSLGFTRRVLTDDCVVPCASVTAYGSTQDCP